MHLSRSTAVAAVLLVSAGVVTGQSEGRSDGQSPDAVHITGTHSLGRMLSSGSSTFGAGGVRHLRELEAIQVDDFSDPRLTGQTHVVHSEDIYPSGLGPRWGEVVHENEGGTWAGAYVAWILPRDEGPDIPVYTTLFEGAGGYEGWSALCQSTYPQGPGWDGESECLLIPGPIPRLLLPEP